MRTQINSYALSISVTAGLLAGCGVSQPSIGAPGATPQSPAIATHAERGGSWMQRPKTRVQTQYKMSGPLLYITNYNAAVNDVTIYHANAKDPSPLAVITDGIEFPEGDCVDSAGTLYVANSAGTGWISEYPAGKLKPSKMIKKGINFPAFCAIDAEGNLWVTNFGGANVSEYRKGSTKPQAIITKGLNNPIGIAIDDAGNLYVSNRTGSGYAGNVQVYSPGSKSPSRTITTGVTSPSGIAVDAKSTLYVTNFEENTVEEYVAGTGTPYMTITDGLDVPTDVNVNKKGYLFVNNYSSNVVVEYAPGSVTPLGRHISKDLRQPEGSAYYPPLLP